MTPDAGAAKQIRPLHLTVRTSPFHGDNEGSIPLGVTTKTLAVDAPVTNGAGASPRSSRTYPMHDWGDQLRNMSQFTVARVH